MNSNIAFRISAAFGFFAVALGAFGAHGLKALLERLATTDPWQTAALYHLVHSAILLFVSAREPFRAGVWAWFAMGIVLFSGSLYLYATTLIHWLVFVTPLGGICLLAGWLSLVFKPRERALRRG